MECPHCGSLNSKVVDSRLTSDRVSIRRRRKCLACWERFTTYESTEERILPILIRKKARHGATKGSLKTTLAFISKTLKVLSNETKKLVTQADKLDRAQSAAGAKRKATNKAASKKKGTYANDTKTDDRLFGKRTDERQGNIPGGENPGKRGL
jgi:transcriptional regulator NrdR family protein